MVVFCLCSIASHFSMKNFRSQIFSVTFFHFYSFLFVRMFWESIFIRLFDRQTCEGETENKKKTKRIECTLVRIVCTKARSRQDSQSVDLTYAYLGGIRLLQWLATYTQSLSKNVVRCTQHSTIDIVCIVFVAVAAAAPSLLVLFYDIFLLLSIFSHESRSDGRTWRAYDRVYDYLCAQFLVRFINDVTFNICETWAQNQFSIRIIPFSMHKYLLFSVALWLHFVSHVQFLFSSFNGIIPYF